MTCHRGTSDIVPLPADFASDDEVQIYLGLPNSEQGRAIAAATTPTERRLYAETRALENELRAGRIPRGVIACDRKPRKGRRK